MEQLQLTDQNLTAESDVRFPETWGKHDAYSATMAGRALKQALLFLTLA